MNLVAQSRKKIELSNVVKGLYHNVDSGTLVIVIFVIYVCYIGSLSMFKIQFSLVLDNGST